MPRSEGEGWRRGLPERLHNRIRTPSETRTWLAVKEQAVVPGPTPLLLPGGRFTPSLWAGRPEAGMRESVHAEDRVK